jgi:hypothetical protein
MRKMALGGLFGETSEDALSLVYPPLSLATRCDHHLTLLREGFRLLKVEE